MSSCSQEGFYITSFLCHVADFNFLDRQKTKGQILQGMQKPHLSTLLFTWQIAVTAVTGLHVQ